MNLIEQRKDAAMKHVQRLRSGLPWIVSPHHSDPLKANVYDRFGNSVARNLSRVMAEFIVDGINADHPKAQSAAQDRK
jgi:hypothetical protein